MINSLIYTKGILLKQLMRFQEMKNLIITKYIKIPSNQIELI